MATKLAAVGEYDVIMPFSAVGVEIYPVTSEHEFIKTVQELIEENVGVIFVSDKFLSGAESIFKEVSFKPLPCLLSIPGPLGASGFTRERMRNLVKKACGVDLMGGRKGSL
ncbi:hypothetical protein KAX02_12065 [candidate division WOR-3 bacterium]|nr:hypothetical protein [candidate division WOR-3 bacterium]